MKAPKYTMLVIFFHYENARNFEWVFTASSKAAARRQAYAYFGGASKIKVVEVLCAELDDQGEVEVVVTVKPAKPATEQPQPEAAEQALTPAAATEQPQPEISQTQNNQAMTLSEKIQVLEEQQAFITLYDKTDDDYDQPYQYCYLGQVDYDKAYGNTNGDRYEFKDLPLSLKQFVADNCEWDEEGHYVDGDLPFYVNRDDLQDVLWP